MALGAPAIVVEAGLAADAGLLQFAGCVGRPELVLGATPVMPGRQSIKQPSLFLSEIIGAPDRSRTCDLCLALLYLAEQTGVVRRLPPVVVARVRDRPR